jgi:peptidyl-prolyl cis-trans isomerase B (cyclophilin B)
MFASLSFSAQADGGQPSVKLETNMGDIVIALNAEKAPKTVENFLQYVEDGFYNGTIFHRVIKNFMIQGGGFTESFEQKSTRAPVENEADNGLSNKRGSIAMARTNDPHSATAQFFINVVDNDFLDFRGKDPSSWGYAVFGEVVEGMDVVDKIREVSTTMRGPHQDVPADNVVIEKATVIK